MSDQKSTREVLTQLERTVLDGNVDKFKKLYSSIEYTSNSENQVANLVILACKHNKVIILKYLLSSGYITKTAILPHNEDETHYNAFYYAMRSGNIELLDTLISKWPDNFFTDHLGKLDKIISSAYEELNLKNVPLSDEMRIFIEEQLINVRFFSDNSKQAQNIKTSFKSIHGRMGLVFENIKLLNAEYSNEEEVNERFLFIAQFIARNIYVLKRQLKATYLRLPWEEIEFCLVSFISSHIKQQKINLFYQATLDKVKILNYLENFSKKLQDEQNKMKVMDINCLAELPNLNREKVVANIISNFPQFENLYHDHQQIRDIHSLMKITDYIELALSADPKEREGQLIITRVLQIIGEYVKNSLESPKLSHSTNKLLLLSLPTNTRKIITDLRNSLSHAYSLSKRTHIEEIKDVEFFILVQNDIKKIGTIITDILYKRKIKTVIMLLKKLLDSENLTEINKVIGILKNIKIDEINTDNFQMMELESIEKLTKKLSNVITGQTHSERQMFFEINEIINFEKSKLKNMRTSYVVKLVILKQLGDNFYIEYDDTIKVMKFCIVNLLKYFNQTIESHGVKKVAELSLQIFRSVKLRVQNDTLEVINRIFSEIFTIAQFETGNIKWIEELKEQCNEKVSFKHTETLPETYNNQMTLKLSELKNILKSHKFTENFPSYKSNKKLQAVLEMLVLDIMSILGTSKNSLENNLLFLDDNSPLLTGKCLRNHLAHDNALVDLLISDPSISVVLNAKKLTTENIIKNEKKIGKILREDLSKLKDKLDRGLVTINNQEKMFIAAEEGNLDDLKNCIKSGADINGRSINLSTTLHFAAKGTSLEVIQFILAQNINCSAKDINNQTPLHIAAANGRTNIVEFLVKKVGLHVDDVDSNSKTPLHSAALKGHMDTVEVLLKHNACTAKWDSRGYSPLHYAVEANHKDVVRLLLEKEINVDNNEAAGGYTLLHIAAGRGYIELVSFLLQYKANVNAKNDKEVTPLHAATLNGHLEIVNALISEGADIMPRDIEGFTPLHYAVENCHEQIADILLKHGSNVNASDNTCKKTPLHYAAKFGHEQIVKTLLKHKANVSAVTFQGVTPLHFAVQSGHLEIVAALIAHGVNVHAKDNDHFTPLHHAAKIGHKSIAEILIKNRAAINANTRNNLTPLHAAALKGRKDVAELLIKNKARIDAEDVKGNTPLHVAAQNGSRDVIELLIKNKSAVNAKTNDGFTPLHLAALGGHRDAMVFLITNQAEVNARDNHGLTPLDAAVVKGHADCVDILMEYKAKVDEKGISGSTPLFVAVEEGYKKIVEILIANGANVNVKVENRTPLLSAIECNSKEIVKVLIANGANVNIEGGKPLALAVLAGYRDIISILLNNKADVHFKYDENKTALHLAAMRGQKEIVKDLIKKGADINARTINNATPLDFAAAKGFAEVVQVLILNGVNINALGIEGTALHTAAGLGHNKVVEVLLNNGANIDVKDTENRTSVELAVSHGHLRVVKTLFQHKEIHVNAKGNDGWTMLHIAAQSGHLEITRYLVEKGANINATNMSRAKPIHIAAREGHKNIVEFFLSKGSSIYDFGPDNHTPLHYTAIGGKLEVAEYLLQQGININIKDVNGRTPVHIAAYCGHKYFIEVLLKNGAIHNAVDTSNKTPLELATNKEVINLLTSTKKLFQAVKHNKLSEVDNYIKAEAVVNAKDTDSVTALHYAAWKGYDAVVNILLKNKANPNAICGKGFTPLHFAAKFSHLKAVNILLSNGAVYNAVSADGKTPLDLSVNKSITSLFKLLSESFKNIANNSSQVLNNLNKIKDIDTIKAIMNAHNSEKQTLIVAGVHSNFSEIEQLKEISQGNISTEISKALQFANEGNYQKALCILRNAFEIREQILGSRNPGTLDIQTNIAKILFLQGFYQHALNTFDDVFQKQKEVLGLNDKDTLVTRSAIASVLHKQGKNDEAIAIYQEVYQKQTEILGPNHLDTLSTHCDMALVLDRQGKYEEALNINRGVFEKRKQISGANDPFVVRAQNNIALVLFNMGNYGEALKIYEEVYEKKKVIFGINHADTLRTLHNIAALLFKQNKHNEAMKAYQEVLNIKKTFLGPNHPDTFETQCNIASILLAQGKSISALEAFRDCYDQMKAVFGPSHPSVLEILETIKAINSILNVEGIELSEILQHLQKGINIAGGIEPSEASGTTIQDINIAASEGDLQTVVYLLRDGTNVNNSDIEGRTPLHFAISNGKADVVELLLKNGADVTRVTNKGNSPLHTATSKDYKEIVEILLQHVSRNKLDEFINSKTTASGTTSLHIAAKNGSFDVTNSLLKRGAIYNIKNNEGKTPADLSKNQYINNLLKLIEELFKDAQNGDVEIINKLKGLKHDEILAVTNARNSQRVTLLQVAVVNNNRSIAAQILQAINMTPKVGCGKTSEAIQQLQKDIRIAVSKGDKPTVESLLKDGADVNGKDIDGRTLLHFAVSNGQLSVVNTLLMYGADVTQVTNKGNTPLHTAASKNYKDIIEIMLKLVCPNKLMQFINAKTTASGTTALHISAKNGSFDVTNILLKWGAIYNIRNNEGKIPADHSKEKNVINLLKLIEELFKDAEDGNVEVINKLKAVRPDEFLAITNARNIQAATLLQTAKTNKNYIIATQLLEAINMMKMESRKTSDVLQHLQKDIKIAARNGDIHTVESLLKDGADVNDRDSEGRAPLHYAVSNGQIDLVNILLKNGADVTQVTNKGNTPLHTATSKDYKEIIKVLLSHVCPSKLNDFINAKTTTFGTTSLHVAARNGSLDVITILLKRGAIYDIKNKEGKTPADLSTDQDVKKLLKLVEDLFRYAQNDNLKVINKLKAVRSDQFLAITNASNSQGATLLQIVNMQNG